MIDQNSLLPFKKIYMDKPVQEYVMTPDFLGMSIQGTPGNRPYLTQMQVQDIHLSKNKRFTYVTSNDNLSDPDYFQQLQLKMSTQFANDINEEFMDIVRHNSINVIPSIDSRFKRWLYRVFKYQSKFFIDHRDFKNNNLEELIQFQIYDINRKLFISGKNHQYFCVLPIEICDLLFYSNNYQENDFDRSVDIRPMGKLVMNNYIVHIYTNLKNRNEIVTGVADEYAVEPHISFIHCVQSESFSEDDGMTRVNTNLKYTFHKKDDATLSFSRPNLKHFRNLLFTTNKRDFLDHIKSKIKSIFQK